MEILGFLKRAEPSQESSSRFVHRTAVNNSSVASPADRPVAVSSDLLTLCRRQTVIEVFVGCYLFEKLKYFVDAVFFSLHVTLSSLLKSTVSWFEPW